MPSGENRRDNPPIGSAEPVSISAVSEEPELDTRPSDGSGAAQLSGASAPISSAPGTLQIETGDVIARRYQVEGVLGEGGMGIVYRCLDLHIQKPTALKRVIVPDGTQESDYVTWFSKEARALASLDHPNIVHARDFGQLSDGSPFLAMELVSGYSLHDLAQATLGFPLIWSIADQIMSALAHAHAHGVVHGDLKPSNVIVREIPGKPPQVHILDFGLAWLKEDPHDERLDGEKRMEFVPHAGAGTPGYMAPEQIMHEMHHVEGPTDLYALACILFKLIGGRAPFRGDPKELLKLHAYENPPLLKPVISVPDGVVEFITRLLQKRPWQRYMFAQDARRAWAKVRPAVDDPAAWRFPKIAATASYSDLAHNQKDFDSGVSSSHNIAATRGLGLLGIRQTPLIGRDDLRQILSNVADDVISGRGAPHRLAMLLGPAGVGKSRVAEWFCSEIHEQGKMVPLVARYRKMRGSTDGMLGAVTQHLNFEHSSRDTIERSLMARWDVKPDDRTMLTWVAGVAEWLRPVRDDSDYVGPTGVRFAMDTLATRRQVIRFALRKIANGRPLLFFLDDLHNATPTTLEGLERIHDEEPDQPIFMVATVRMEDVQRGTPTAQALRALRDKLHGHTVEVSPMGREMTEALLLASLPLDRDAVLEATRRSRGYPLFALQQLHAWNLAGKLEFRHGGYHVPHDVLAVRPQTTAEFWEERLLALPQNFREAALAASTVGADIRRAVLVKLLETLNLPVEPAIRGMQRAEVLIPRGVGRYTWPHTLLQEHLLGLLSRRADARRFFMAAATALKSHPLSHTRRVVRQQVLNLIYARENNKAADTFFAFLEHSWNGARQPAATLADLDLFENLVVGRSKALCQKWRAEALRHVGRTEEAKAFAEQALEQLMEVGTQAHIADCMRLLGHVTSALGDSKAGLSWAEQALALSEADGNILGMAQCESVIAEIEYLRGNYERARRVATLGATHFAERSQPMGRGACLLLLSWIAHTNGETALSRQLTLEARAEFERTGYRLGIAQTTASLAHIEHRLGNLAAASLGAAEALSLFDSVRNLRGQAATERLLAMLRIDDGHPEDAAEHAERALVLYTEMGDPWGLVEARLLQAQVALLRKKYKLAHACLNEANASAPEEPEPQQHALLTEAWYRHCAGDIIGAHKAISKAKAVFDAPWQVGDHTPQILTQLQSLDWSTQEQARTDIEEWRSLIAERASQASA